MRNKIFTIFIAFAMMFETVGVIAYAEEPSAAEEKENEIQTEQIENFKDFEEYPLLNVLNIVSDEPVEEYSSNVVTRGEASVYLARMYKKDIDLSASAEYVDVEAHRAISPYIDFAQKMGLFNNMDRRRFRPDEPITKDELSIMACRVLGYGNIYDLDINYPEQYYEQADSSKIFRGTAAGNTISRKNFFKILVNILNADVCKLKSIGTDISFTTGPSLMEERFEVIKEKGIVTGYGFTNLKSSDEIPSGKISISQEIYNIDAEQGKDYTEYVGHTVDYFLDISDEGEKKVIFINQSDISTEVNLPGEDIDINSNTETIIYYNEEDRKITRKVSSGAVAFYNGKNMGSFSESLLEKLFDEESNIKLIDNNGDNALDFIFIYQYETYVIDSIDTASKRIYLKYDKLINGNRYISLTEEDGYKAELLINGVPTELERLRTDNVLSCIPTYDGGKLENLRIIVSRRSVTGTVSQASEDTYIINGNEYRISEHYRSIAGKYPDTPEIKLGSEGKFFLDALGNIAYAKLTKEIYYGYMKRLYPKNVDDIDSEDDNTEYGVEIFDETGVWFEGDLADKVIFNGNKVTKLVCARQLRETGRFEQQVVRFSIKNDKVSMIDTVQTGSGDSYYDTLELKDTYQASMGTDYGNITGRYYRFINQTIFMLLPENKEKKDQYSVIGRYSFAEGQNVYLKVYGIDEFNTVTFCVYDYSDMPALDSYENYVMIVENVVQTLNEDDEIIKRAEGYYARGGWGSGEITEGVLDEAEPGVFKNVKNGDVLMFKLNSERKAVSAKAAFTLEEAKTSEPFHKNNTLKDETSFGTILKVDPSRSLLLMDIGGTTTVFWYGAVAAFDMEKGKVVKINPADLTPGRKVFNWGYWNLPFLTLMYIE